MRSSKNQRRLLCLPFCFFLRFPALPASSATRCYEQDTQRACMNTSVTGVCLQKKTRQTMGCAPARQDGTLSYLSGYICQVRPIQVFNSIGKMKAKIGFFCAIPSCDLLHGLKPSLQVLLPLYLLSLCLSSVACWLSAERFGCLSRKQCTQISLSLCQPLTLDGEMESVFLEQTSTLPLPKPALVVRRIETTATKERVCVESLRDGIPHSMATAGQPQPHDAFKGHSQKSRHPSSRTSSRPRATIFLFQSDLPLPFYQRAAPPLTRSFPALIELATPAHRSGSAHARPDPEATRCSCTAARRVSERRGVCVRT